MFLLSLKCPPITLLGASVVKETEFNVELQPLHELNLLTQMYAKNNVVTASKYCQVAMSWNLVEDHE